MTRLRLLGAFTLVVAAACFAGEHKPQVLLEVTQDAGGMTTPLKDHLYLRVFEDGSAEWQAPAALSSDAGHPGAAEGPIQKSRLGKSASAHLAWLLRAPAVRTLERQYGPFADYIDSWQSFTFRFFNGKFERKVTMSDPDTHRLAREMPDGLKALYCEATRLRIQAEKTDPSDEPLLKACADDPAGQR